MRADAAKEESDREAAKHTDLRGSAALDGPDLRDAPGTGRELPCCAAVIPRSPQLGHPGCLTCIA
jgi:hypothetical protein